MQPIMSANLAAFFLLVFALSIPFYLLGAVGGRLPILTAQPTSALMAFMPMISALILVYRARGSEGATNLLKRALDFDRVRSMRWYLAAVCLLPVIAVLQYAALQLIGTALPVPQFAIVATPLFFVMYFAGAIGEEIGWQGYAFPELRSRHSALLAAGILGAYWALWHVIPFLQIGRTTYWIFWHCLGIVALRVIIAWLFANTGQSVFIAVLFHTMINLPWSIISNYGTIYGPFMTFVLLMLLVGAIVALWGAATLARFRYSR
jgi:membrane protease YdiL (CAAX protease family)